MFSNVTFIGGINVREIDDVSNHFQMSTYISIPTLLGHDLSLKFESYIALN